MGFNMEPTSEYKLLPEYNSKSTVIDVGWPQFISEFNPKFMAGTVGFKWIKINPE